MNPVALHICMFESVPKSGTAGRFATRILSGSLTIDTGDDLLTSWSQCWRVTNTRSGRSLAGFEMRTQSDPGKAIKIGALIGLHLSKRLTCTSNAMKSHRSARDESRYFGQLGGLGDCLLVMRRGSRRDASYENSAGCLSSTHWDILR